MQLFGTDPLSGLSVDSPQFRQRAKVDQLSNDPDTATQQTVGKMCEIVRQAAGDQWVRQVAIDAVRRFRGGPLWMGSGVNPFQNVRVMAESCWWWCKHNLKFKHHDDMFVVWSSDLGDPRNKMQLLISPSVLLRMRRMDGDCAIYTMMLAAMMESLGVKWEICTGAVNAAEPDIFSHVWPRAVLEDGGREPLDASHGKYPGWQVPDYDIHRLKVWDKSGRETANEAPRFFGLHAYRLRGRGRRFGMGAAGDCLAYDNTTGDCIQYDLGIAPSDGGAPITSPSTACTCVNGTCVENGNSCAGGSVTASSLPTGSVVVPNQSSAAWAAAISALGKMGFTLAEIQAMPAGTVVNPNGQIIRQAPGYAVTPGGAGSSLSVTGGSSSMLPILLIAGIGLFAVMGSRH